MMLDSEAVDTGSTIAGEDLCAGFNLYHRPVIDGVGVLAAPHNPFRGKEEGGKKSEIPHTKHI